MKDDKYINDRFNFILLTAKKREYKLTRKEKKELSRLLKTGYFMGESGIVDYIRELQSKAMVNMLPTGNQNEYIVSVTGHGLKALKHNHFKSLSLQEGRNQMKMILSNIAKIAAIATFVVLLISLIITIGPCSKNIDSKNNVNKDVIPTTDTTTITNRSQK